MNYTVVDVETTGVYSGGHDRIVEVALLALAPDLTISREFTTLINPGRDIGPTWLHGIRTADVLQAPTFPEVAGTIVELLKGSVAVGHNVGFDLRFLESEFARAGTPIPRAPSFDTMSVAVRMGAPSRRLEEACDLFGIDFSVRHSALGDARATAHLFARCIEHFGHESLDDLVCRSEASTPADWPMIEARGKSWPRQRAAELRREERPFLAGLIRDLPVSDGEVGDWQAYYALLDRALEDRRISEDEASALSEAVIEAGLSAGDVKTANETYLRTLVAVALHDQVLSDSERRDIQEVAGLFALEAEVDEMLGATLATGASAPRSGNEPPLKGRTVCFTGAMNASIEGERATRERATVIAIDHGMIVVKGVTKKLDYLVMADPDSMSGKAKKAHKYGTRILAESVFWNLVGVNTDG